MMPFLLLKGFSFNSYSLGYGSCTNFVLLPGHLLHFVRSVNCTSLAHSVGSLTAKSSFLRLPQRQHPVATHNPCTGSCQPSLLFPPHIANAPKVTRSLSV